MRLRTAEEMIRGYPMTLGEKMLEAISGVGKALNEIRDELKEAGCRRQVRHEIGTFSDNPKISIGHGGGVEHEVTLIAGKWRIVAEKVD